MVEHKGKIILEIEGSPVECIKEVLIENSPYFTAMFGGSFKESTQTTIKIEGVDVKSFNTILLLLWDSSYFVDINELHIVLQAACMLQFSSIKKICEDRILALLNPSICVKIWKTAELLDISPLWLKAKYMALEEFREICDSKPILELSLDDICDYLGHVYLNAPNELSVFQVAMNWWYENQEQFEGVDSTSIFLRLLNCIDFKKLKNNEINEMQTYPDIFENAKIVSILDCILELLEFGINICKEFSKDHLNYAIHLCNSRSRRVPEIPCILLQREWADDNHHPNKKSKSNPTDDKNIIIYDSDANKFSDLFVIDGDKLRDLAGCKFLSYKEFVFLYGGEFIIGAGNWNKNFWSYDTIKGKWERKSVLPQGRRHFETVRVDNRIYIVGGLGRYRVIQENLLWYDFKSDEWSTDIPLPYSSRDFKCCSLNGQLLLIYFSNKRAYSFNVDLRTWKKIEIMIEDEVFSAMGECTIFSDCNYIYVKGKLLMKFKLYDETLVPIRRRVMDVTDYEEIEAVLCDTIVYTLYRSYFDAQYYCWYTLEALDLETDAVRVIFRIKDKSTLEVGDKRFCLTQNARLLSFYYYNLVKENIFIHDSIIQ